jgi:hypothetical protein
MPTLNEYLERLRALIPARTLAIYMVGITLVLGLAQKAEDVPKQYPTLILFVAGLSLVFNILGGLLLDKKKLAAVGISSGALLLFMASQRFVGPLAALGFDTQGLFIVIALLSAVLVSLAPVLYKGEINR